MKLIAPSVLSADFARLAEEIKAVEVAGADWIHVDVMDGHFVPNITIGPQVVASLRKVTRLPLDVHLMIENPERYIEAFAIAGSDIITIHVETTDNLHRLVADIKGNGIKAGVSLNPVTDMAQVEPILTEIDLLLLMSVNPGFGGQKFIPSSIDKIKQASAMRNACGGDFLIEIDGGITVENIGTIATVGVDVFVAGSTIFGSANYAETIATMKSQAR